MRAISRLGLTTVVSALLLCSGATAGVVLEPKSAPQWKVSEWLNSDPGDLSKQRGQVVLIHFFQLWCPGCNEFSIPLFQRWEDRFGSRDDVTIVAIHTVFEGHDIQTPEQLRLFIEEKGIQYPVGIDAYPSPESEIPITMDRFETGGTPHVVIVDKKGLLRFTHFGHFDAEPVEAYIDRILSEKKSFNTRINSRHGDRQASDSSSKGRDKPRRGQGQEAPPAEPGDTPEAEAEPARNAKARGERDSAVSGSYKLRFEQLANSCGDPAPTLEVITQVSVYEDRIEAKFSRAFLGLRQVTAGYDAGSGDIFADLEQTVQDKGVEVSLSLQLSGNILIGTDPPEIDFRYYVEQRRGEGDCVIEGEGSGGRMRSRSRSGSP
jgi:thiol-disulfide isomerase/thioredoxin